jgi:hypothetical protein
MIPVFAMARVWYSKASVSIDTFALLEELDERNNADLPQTQAEG